MSDPMANWNFRRCWGERARPPPKRKRPALASNRPLIEGLSDGKDSAANAAAPAVSGGLIRHQFDALSRVAWRAPDLAGDNLSRCASYALGEGSQ